MSLFRQQALQQRHLPEPLFTPVAVVSVRRWVWLAMGISLLSMAAVWLIFGRLYTTYDTTMILTGSQTVLSLPMDINLLSPVPAVAVCPHTIHGHVTASTDRKAVLHLDTPVQGECHITLILREQSPLEQLLS
jgi:hypothetical protein